MPRNQNNPNEFIAGVLPTISYNGNKYFVDGRLREMRNVNDFMDKIYDTDEVFDNISQEDISIICYEFEGSKIKDTSNLL